DTQDELATLLLGEAVVVERLVRGPDVRVAGGRGGEAHPNWFRRHAAHHTRQHGLAQGRGGEEKVKIQKANFKSQKSLKPLPGSLLLSFAFCLLNFDLLF